MALDLKTMNEAYFQGFGEWVPMGLIGPSWKKANNPFETWPEEVKKTYSYDPEGAKKLLAEAGYPNGFKTVLHNNQVRWDTGYRELAAGYWAKIGVEVEINAIDNTAICQFNASYAGKECGRIDRFREHRSRLWGPEHAYAWYLEGDL